MRSRKNSSRSKDRLLNRVQRFANEGTVPVVVMALHKGKFLVAGLKYYDEEQQTEHGTLVYPNINAEVITLLSQHPTVDGAFAYACEVLNENDTFPCLTSADDIIHATVRTGVMATCKNFTYSGMLQVPLLAHAVGCSIKVFVDQEYELEAKVSDNSQEWHWIACAFTLMESRWVCLIMDSLGGASHRETVSYLWKFMVASLELDSPAFPECIHVKVPKQEGVNCGVMMLQNIQVLISQEVDLSSDEVSLVLQAKKSGRVMRCLINHLMYQTLKLM